LVRHPGYFGAAIAGIDSNIRIAVANGMMEDTILGSISTAAQSFGKRSLGLLSFGGHHRSWVLGDKGKYVVSVIDPYTIFIAVSQEKDIEPDISPVIEKMCVKLTELV
jgi:predicted regulator of Ras-like GTPase activity (Roadblock/LC7/MglB family)